MYLHKQIVLCLLDTNLEWNSHPQKALLSFPSEGTYSDQLSWLNSSEISILTVSIVPLR